MSILPILYDIKTVFVIENKFPKLFYSSFCVCLTAEDTVHVKGVSECLFVGRLPS
jgi:hypothetical protein